MWQKIEETTFADIFYFYFSSFIFKENHVFIEEDNLSDKVVIDEEELHDIDIDDIGNLDNLLRTECLSIKNVEILKYFWWWKAY